MRETTGEAIKFWRSVARLRERLQAPLPGLETFMEMAPENPRHRRVTEARAAGCREGAVLVVLYPVEEQVHLVLTVRAAHLSNHAGQISLPGGRVEPGEQPVEAALREAWEEIGIPVDELVVLGSLSPLYIPPSNYCLTPIVAALGHQPVFEPHDGEVAAVLEVPVRHFTERGNRLQETHMVEGTPRRVPYYPFGEQKIWGATAMILTEFGVVWEQAEWSAG